MIPSGFVTTKKTKQKVAARKRRAAKKAGVTPIRSRLKIDPDTGQEVHAPTAELRKQVEQMAALGLAVDGICAILNIARATLEKHYAEQLTRGPAQANQRVAAALFKRAVNDGNVDAQKFWLKARAGWRDNLELTGAGGGAIVIKLDKDDAAL